MMGRKDPEAKRAYEREYRKRWPVATQAKQQASWRRYAQTDGGKAACASRKQSYNQRNPDQPKAMQAVKYALRSGRLTRPAQCAQCRRRCKPQAHHFLGYAKEHRLTVEWLCRTCHGVQHESS